MKHNYNLLICFNAIPQAFNTFLSKQKTHTFSFFVFIFTLLGFSNAFGQTTITQTTPGNYTFTVPCDVTSITVQAWGAGGGGYGDNNDDNITGRGGGGGGNNGRNQLLELLNAKINSTKIENAKEDVIRFVQNPNELDIWSRDYFNILVENLKVDK